VVFYHDFDPLGAGVGRELLVGVDRSATDRRGSTTPGSQRTVGEPIACAVSMPLRYIAERRFALRRIVDEMAGLFQSTPKSSGMLTTRERALSSRALNSATRRASGSTKMRQDDFDVVDVVAVGDHLGKSRMSIRTFAGLSRSRSKAVWKLHEEDAHALQPGSSISVSGRILPKSARTALDGPPG
jgi:hypothetical protein